MPINLHMLYIFKSKATGNLIMLQPNGERVLRIIGKDAGPTGIVLPEQMPAAISALEDAIVEEESAKKTDAAQDQGAENGTAQRDRVSLRQRALPFIDMLKRCHQADEEIVWGV